MSGAGRFAPSPTGPLHEGSLVAALASFLDARAHGLKWWVRMEDLDPPREQAGAAAQILQQLRDHGLTWDDWPDAPRGVLFQSARHAAYETALQALRSQFVFACSCTRSQLEEAVRRGETTRLPEGEVRYPGTCRHAPAQAQTAARSWRFCSPQGENDFVVRRADGLWAYHLAVVVDDAYQGVTRVVRGVDLEQMLPRHRWLQEALGLPKTEVLHVPLVVNARGEKLSKQTQAPALGSGQAVHGQLTRAWTHLEQHMPRAWVERVLPVWKTLC